MVIIRVSSFRTLLQYFFSSTVTAFILLKQSYRLQQPLHYQYRNIKASRVLNMQFSNLKDYVKVDVSLMKDGNPVESPYDTGVVGFVLGGGRYFPALNSRLESMIVGESASFTTTISEAQAELIAEIPIENAPVGLRYGDRVKLSNGMSALISKVTDTFITIDANPPLAGVPVDVNIKLLERFPHEKLSQATFAAGCFWGLELAFQRLNGVAFTAVGYTYGQVEDPSYEAVCSGTTGHAEAVTVLYNPADVTYSELLNVFWGRHDPTQLNQQGNDVGTQYRGGIYYHSEEQKLEAMESMKAVQLNYKDPLATELLEATKFWIAEDYHQQYLEKGGQSSKKTAVEKIRCYG